MQQWPGRGALAAAALLVASAFGAQTAQASIVARGGAIDVVDNAQARPFPSKATVTGAGTITKVTVTLEGISHGCPIDLDVQLVSPAGTRVLLMSDAGAPPGGGCPAAEG